MTPDDEDAIRTHLRDVAEAAPLPTIAKGVPAAAAARGTRRRRRRRVVLASTAAAGVAGVALLSAQLLRPAQSVVTPEGSVGTSTPPIVRSIATSRPTAPTTVGSATSTIDTSPAPAYLDVVCNGATLSLGGTKVAAAQDGVHVRMISTGARPSSFTFEWDGESVYGGGIGLEETGQIMSAAEVILAPPGEIRVSCGIDQGRVTSPEQRVIVTDPKRVYRTTTLTDLGCPGWNGHVGRWFDGRAGLSARDALDNLANHYPGQWDSVSQAAIGYPHARVEYWVLKKGGKPIGTAMVSREASQWTANRVHICGLPN